MSIKSLEIAVVGAGPVGLGLALHAARTLPAARITVFDARAADKDVSADPRALALSLGSVQWLQRLGAWPAEAAQPILTVHVSQAPPTLPTLPALPALLGSGFGVPEVRIHAADEGVPMLGAVLAYGQLVAPLQRAWEAAVQAEPQRLFSRFGTPVSALKDVAGGVEVDAGVAERFDLAVVAEGGVFADQARKALVHDYQQTAWVGRVQLQGGSPGVAFERFTRHGPAALLPLPPLPDGSAQAALVWCVPTASDPVRELNDAQRVAVLNTLFAEAAGQITGTTPLKAFPLGLNAERTLVQGRRVRIGNAAQTLHPVAGQGLNLGLRDAHELVAVLRFATDLDAALRRVEWARAADRWAMIGITDFLARSFTWGWPGFGAARGLALAALQAATPLKSLLARRMMFGGRWSSLLDPAYLDQRARLIGTQRLPQVPAGQPGAAAVVSWAPMPDQREYGTSHISIADPFGNTLAMTTTIESAFGARLMVGDAGFPGGFLLNNQLTDFSFTPRDAQGRPVANRVEPGKRPRSSMSPTLVFDKATGELLMSAGSPGGALIIHFTAKTLLGTLNGGLGPQAAIDLPNFGSVGGPLLLEAGRFPAATVQALQGLGHTVSETPMPSGLQALKRGSADGKAVWLGGADPRREGIVAGD